MAMSYCIKGKKDNISAVLLSFHQVGMTRLELATSRPPDVCATNCATSRYLLLAERLFPPFAVQRYDIILYCPNLFVLLCIKIR